MRRIITLLTRSATGKDTIILFVGSAISVVLGTALVFLLNHNLTQGDFGLFITSLTFYQLVVDMFELGVNPSVLNFGASQQGIEKEKYIKTTFIIRLSVGIVVTLGLLLLAHPLALFIFRNEQMTSFIQISAIGIIPLMLIFWGIILFQSHKRFVESVVLSSLMYVTRVGFILPFILLGTLTAVRAYTLINIALWISVIYLFWRYGFSFLQSKINPQHFKTVLKFSLPIGAGFALASVYSRIDQILLFNLLGKEEAAIYGIAFRISTVILFASIAFNSALNPRFASLDKDKFMAYFKKALLATVGLAVACLIAIPLAPIVIPLFFKPEYRASILPFQILVLGTAFFVVYSPFNSAILYRFKKPYFSLIVSAISLGVLYLLLSYLIPLYRSTGTALSIAILYFCQMIISVGYFGYLYIKDSKSMTKPA